MEQLNRDFKGVWIPKFIWLDKRLTFLDKVILIEIDSLDSDEKGCWASNEYLAEFCQCSITKVSLAITKLMELNYLELENFNGRQRVLRSCLSKSERQTFKNLKADIKKVKGSNKENNISNNIDDIINEFNFPLVVVEAVKEWLDYKKEKGQKYKDRGLKALLKTLKKMSDEKGEQALINAINYSMANNYSGIYEPSRVSQKGKENTNNETHNEYDGIAFGHNF